MFPRRHRPAGDPCPRTLLSAGSRTLLGTLAVAAGTAVAVLYSQHQLAPAAVPQGPPTSAVSSTRLLDPVTGPPGRGGYTFTHRHPDGSPVTYNPCRELRYVVNPAGGPAGSVRMIRAAVADISAATGLVFTYAGTTDEVAAADREPVQADRYGTGWAPVLIGFSDARREPALRGQVAGLGGSTRVSGEGVVPHYVTGRIVLDRDQLRTAGAYTRGVVLHELGHIAGLTHTRDRRQLMHSETIDGLTSLSPGDRRGLAELGRGTCATS